MDLVSCIQNVNPIFASEINYGAFCGAKTWIVKIVIRAQMRLWI